MSGEDIGIAFFFICIIVCVLLYFTRIQGISYLSNKELNTITDIVEIVCRNNDGFKKVEFYPSSKYEVDVFCNNGAVFNDISYVRWKKDKK